MNHPRRHVFHGNAHALSFRIRRPVDAILPVQASSSLPVTGGRCESRVGPGSLPKPGSAVDYIRYASAASTAEGDYADQQAAVAMTRYEVPFDSVPAHTSVTAEVTGLVVIGRVEIDLAAIALQAKSAEFPDEHSHRCEGIRLEGIHGDGFP